MDGESNRFSVTISLAPTRVDSDQGRATKADLDRGTAPMIVIVSTSHQLILTERNANFVLK